MKKNGKSGKNAALEYFKYLEREEQLRNEAKDILYKEDYYDKLITILKKKAFIGNYEVNVISKDEAFVSKYLEFLYDMINTYANKNYISLSNSSINYKDTYFTISKDCENGFDYYIYCSLCFEKQDNLIRIDEVLNNIERENTKEIKEKLEEFKEMIISYSKMGIPTSALDEASKDVITKIRKKEME